jgi:hypothetical protein
VNVDRGRAVTLAAIVISSTHCEQPARSADDARDAGQAVDPTGDASAADGNNSADTAIDASGRGVADAAALREFDLGRDFSFSVNPNGPWRYGYTGGTTLRLESFLLDAFGMGPDDGGIGFWHPSDGGGVYSPISNPDDGGGGYYPYVACNPGTVTVIYSASWAARSREIAMEASNAGQFSVVEFIAPETGQYRVQAHFEGIHFRLSSTDVHVLLGDTELWQSSIAGYGGDPAAHTILGMSPAADYTGTVAAQANDVISFAVGFGSDDTNYNDTTGLTVHISEL